MSKAKAKTYKSEAMAAVHEMMEALDPNYESELARSVMAECERLLDEEAGT